MTDKERAIKEIESLEAENRAKWNRTESGKLIPTVHLNGTSRDELVATLTNASEALDAAYRAIKLAAPNGRDYYPQGPDAIQTATAEHMNRLLRLDAIKTEIDELAFAIDQQGGR